MKTLMHKLQSLTLTASIALCISVPALAEDTEIYTGGPDTATTIYPNILFIIDTSGSMDTDVTSITVTGTYSSATTYTGDCTSSRIYWSSNGEMPDCSDNDEEDQYIDASANKCDAITAPLSAQGYATSFRAARYRAPGRRGGGYTWSTLSDNDHDDHVECQTDWGIHGQSSATNPYPANESNGGPWTNVAGNGINWDTVGDTYNFYSGNYINFMNDPDYVDVVVKTRLEIVQEVFGDLVDTMADNYNIGLMRFSSSAEGGYIVMPMQQLSHDASTGNADDFKDAANDFIASGGTPLSESLYEAYLYYRGTTVDYGDSSTPDVNHAGAVSGTSYNSPIESLCQKNYVVLLTDGEPTSDTGANTNIQSMTDFTGVTGAAACSGNCLDELADYMYSQDCRDDLGADQVVTTYTIGFHTDQQLLEDTATKGGGEYFTASDTADLTVAFSNILNDISDKNTSFTSPAVAVNAFNRFTHRDELYYAVFQPHSQPYWYGNVKRYQLQHDADTDLFFIADANGVDAVDPDTGYFMETSTSFWTDGEPDGHMVDAGGAAKELTLPRTVYTFTGTDPADEDLTDSANVLHEDNDDITKEMLGDADLTDEARDLILQWARGLDIGDEDEDGDETDIRAYMGDPLHSKPRLITYGGTEEDPDVVLYVATNEGYLTAIDTTNGSEIFSFMPQELLANLPALYENNENVSHIYGLDGPLTAWINDANGNGVIYDENGDLESGEFVYLYVGMRRGGNNYYSIDVTDRNAPRLRWVVDGGTGDYVELGQTWSAPSGNRIDIDGDEKMVLVVGGGYDINQDSNDVAENDTVGRAIYFIDAESGERLWWAGPSGSGADLELSAMTNSIPSDVNAIDTNFDGLLDRLYVGDMRAQLWRFDIHNGESAANLVTGGVIAELGGDDEEDNRRFYYQPDVSLAPNSQYINIAIGSGYREHPLDTTIHDAMFIVRDEHIWGPELSGGVPVYDTVTISDLFDATDNVIGEGDDADKLAATSALDSSNGLYIWLNEIGSNAFVGEKVLAPSITYDGALIFTTYLPPDLSDEDLDLCDPEGTGRFFIVDISDGTPAVLGTAVSDEEALGLTREDRNILLDRAGIPPEPSLIFHEEGIVLTIGTEVQDFAGLSRAPKKIYWSVE